MARRGAAALLPGRPDASGRPYGPCSIASPTQLCESNHRGRTGDALLHNSGCACHCRAPIHRGRSPSAAFPSARAQGEGGVAPPSRGDTLTLRQAQGHPERSRGVSLPALSLSNGSKGGGPGFTRLSRAGPPYRPACRKSHREPRKTAPDSPGASDGLRALGGRSRLRDPHQRRRRHGPHCRCNSIPRDSIMAGVPRTASS
jgi:hypothetical protein